MAYEAVGEKRQSYNLSTITTEQAMAILIIACLIMLILISRGFRGFNIGGLSVSAN